MKILLTLLALAASFNSAAFFESKYPTDKTVGVFPTPQEDEPLPKAGTSCAILLRYQIATPTGLEITHVGGTCDATEEAAITAASLRTPASKIAVYAEAALPPVYQCSVSVTWDPAAPGAAAISPAGSNCESTVARALSAAVQAVACVHRDVRCRL